MVRKLENIKFEWLCSKEVLCHLVKTWQNLLPEDIYCNIIRTNTVKKINKSTILHSKDGYGISTWQNTKYLL